MNLQHKVRKGEIYYLPISKNVGLKAEVVETGVLADVPFSRDKQQLIILKVQGKYDIVSVGSLLIPGELIER